MQKTKILLLGLIIALFTWNCGGEGGTRQASLDSTQTKNPENGDDFIDFEDDEDGDGGFDGDGDFGDFVDDFEDGIEDFEDALKDLGEDLKDVAKNFEKDFSSLGGTTKTRTTNNIKRKMSSKGFFKVIGGKIEDYSEDILIKLYEKRGDREIKALLKEKQGKFQFKVVEDVDSLIKDRYGNEKDWLKTFLKAMNDKKRRNRDRDRNTDSDIDDVLDDLDDLGAKDELLDLLRDDNLTDDDLARIVEEAYDKVMMSGDQKMVIKKAIRHKNFGAKAKKAVRDDLDQIMMSSDREDILKLLLEK